MAGGVKSQKTLLFPQRASESGPFAATQNRATRAPSTNVSRKRDLAPAGQRDPIEPSFLPGFLGPFLFFPTAPCSASIFRATSFPKVTKLICRLPKHTLFYSTRVSKTWGPDAVSCTANRDNGASSRKERKPTLPPDFYDPATALQTTAKSKWQCSSGSICEKMKRQPNPYKGRGPICPHLRLTRFRGERPLKRKENSLWGSRGRLGHRSCCQTLCARWFRNIDRIPFRNVGYSFTKSPLHKSKFVLFP